MTPCELEGHPGAIDTTSGCCVFYGILFDSILNAAGFFKGIQVGPPYEGKIVRGVKILRDPDVDMWWAEGRWWPDRRTAVRAGKRMCHV